MAILGADPIIEPNAARDLLDIGADLLAKIRDFNEGNRWLTGARFPVSQGLSFIIRLYNKFHNTCIDSDGV